MQNNKLIKTLKVFTPNEMKLLDKFVCSPYFNLGKGDKDATVLFSILKKYHPSFNHKDLVKERIFYTIFQNKTYSKIKIEKVIGNLHNKVKLFISVQFDFACKIHLSTDYIKGVRQQLTLARFYKDAHHQDWFLTIMGKLQVRQQKEKVYNQDYFYQQYLIENELEEYYSEVNTKRDDLNLQKTIDSLDIYYVLVKLSKVSLIILQNKKIDIEFDRTVYLDDLISLVNADVKYNIPVIKIYVNICLMLLHLEEDRYFDQFKKLFNQHIDEIDEETIKKFKSFERNYIILKLGSTKQSQLKIYKTQLEEGHLYHKDKLTPIQLLNIVKCGLHAKEAEWVLHFIHQHEHRIRGTEFPEKIFESLFAYHDFYNKKFENALDRLNGSYDNLFYNIAIRRLKLKCFYELQLPMLDSEIDAFGIYIRRKSKKLSVNYMESYLGFVNILNRIIHPASFKNEKRISDIKEKIEQRARLVERDWLLEKLKGLQ